jgi:hypothetical protein
VRELIYGAIVKPYRPDVCDRVDVQREHEGFAGCGIGWRGVFYGWTWYGKRPSLGLLFRLGSDLFHDETRDVPVAFGEVNVQGVVCRFDGFFSCGLVGIEEYYFVLSCGCGHSENLRAAASNRVAEECVLWKIGGIFRDCSHCQIGGQGHGDGFSRPFGDPI